METNGKIHAIDISDEQGTYEKNEKIDALDVFGRERKSTESNSQATKKRRRCAGIPSAGVADDFGIVGVKFIFGESVSLLRRILWLVMLLSGMMMITYQIWDRASYFASFPYNVDVELNYVEELTFPSVAFCNFNMFRRSTTDPENLTDLMTQMFGGFSQSVDFHLHDLDATASEDFYIRHAHNKSMLYWAFWKGVTMTKDVFKTILTDFGVCYAFNTGEDGHQLRKVYGTGKSFGLQMILLTQISEYNIGQESGAGFQLMLYSQGDVPLVADLGFALSPGEHVKIGIEITNITNLPPPHGICQDKPLLYHSKYTRNSCRIECMTEFVVQICGCRLFYMPGNATVCNIEQWYYCGRPTLLEFSNHTSQCDCPVPCSRVIYKPNLSHAQVIYPTLAEYWANKTGTDVDTLLNEASVVDIFFQELTVHEVTQRRAYDFFSLLCDIGGALGLWLGGSVLTVIEILDICLRGCCKRKWF
ncbi:acid-sensing ion channel 1C-like [Ptychodera flava]|uniref:acid-sensing ion channel 1C-like n=1 Tax=Ptychodera flava TaxID=63121 RepID=UPI00396A47AF